VRILMLGWEFPPFISGGLGTACYGLTRAITRLRTEVVLVLPTAGGAAAHVHSTEAIQHGAPVILSKSSGVAEVLCSGALKVDFRDVDEMANKIVAVLRHPELGEVLRSRGAAEIRRLTWDDAAGKCVQVYQEQTEASCSQRN